MIPTLIVVLVLVLIGTPLMRWRLVVERIEWRRRMKQPKRWQIFVPRAQLSRIELAYDGSYDVEFRCDSRIEPLLKPKEPGGPERMIVIDTAITKAFSASILDDKPIMQVEGLGDDFMRRYLMEQRIMSIYQRPYSLLITGVT
jgi:hypothetical protein